MKLYVVGIGPGELSQITPAAMAAMEQSDIIAGYTVYVDLVRERFPGKDLFDHRDEAGGRPLAAWRLSRRVAGKDRLDGVQRRRGPFTAWRGLSMSWPSSIRPSRLR